MVTRTSSKSQAEGILILTKIAWAVKHYPVLLLAILFTLVRQRVQAWATYITISISTT
jgi:hypothetical protein